MPFIGVDNISSSRIGKIFHGKNENHKDYLFNFKNSNRLEESIAFESAS